MKKQSGCPMDGNMGVSVVGERGQIVIPKDFRDALKLEAGTKVVLFQYADGPLMIVPMEHMQEMMSRMTTKFQKLAILTKE
jgi:AbrB family looped-hinge helix DNA binding protein